MTAISNQHELYVSPGGATYRLLQHLNAGRRGKGTPFQRILSLLAITWVPMCGFAILEGHALGATPRDSFLLDFATYARFFIGIPILVIAEEFIGTRLRSAGLRFVEDGLVRQEDFPAFERAVGNLARRRDSLVAIAGIIGLAAFGAWRLTLQTAMGYGAVGWASMTYEDGSGVHHSLAALWNRVVAVPVMLFMLYRWLWRILIWTRFLLDVARLNLRLVPTHADRCAGLGFLAFAHLSFGMLGFGMGCVLSAEAAFRIVFEGARVDTFKLPLILLLVATQILFVGPLLVFTPSLARAKRRGLDRYGSLVIEYNRAFDEKWVQPSAGHVDESILGSSDIQSLADMGNSFRFIDEMRPTAFDRTTVFQLAVLSALPGLPLFLLVVPPRQIFEVLSKLVL
ncbi:hypothetical protein AKJ09_04280 [Labilithrix luteola]|uniref:Uncharacterized protein n=1 Tax=Labilithrix luteola TaxID=1391654 RepID=A0A0K1PW39_9BACT|nr:hypothetical protein [Labilithrix luteola]AKU97616.1 hypothetical protein AKJ09_04280 [Labilithrix luteola]